MTTVTANAASTVRRTAGSVAQRTARTAPGTRLAAAADVEEGAGEQPPRAQQRDPAQGGDERVGGRRDREPLVEVRERDRERGPAAEGPSATTAARLGGQDVDGRDRRERCVAGQSW